MRYVSLEGLKKPISSIILGSTYFGTAIDEKTTFAMLDAFIEAGGNAIDTARSYGDGISEQTIARYLRQTGMEGQILLITKGLQPQDDGTPRFSEANLASDIQQSQEALQTEHFDIWFFHRDDVNFKASEVIQMVAPYVEKGIIGTLGASNWTIPRIIEANAYAQKHSLPQFAISEIQYSLAPSIPNSWDDYDLVFMDESSLQWYQSTGMPVFAYASQSKGFFSQAIANGLQGLSLKARRRFLTEENEQKIGRVENLSKELGHSPSQIALGYVNSSSMPTCAIIGCSSLKQLHDSLGAKDLLLSKEHIAYLETGLRDGV